MYVTKVLEQFLEFLPLNHLWTFFGTDLHDLQICEEKSENFWSKLYMYI